MLACHYIKKYLICSSGGAVRVVTLATGTKCIGENHRSNTGLSFIFAMNEFKGCATDIYLGQ